MNVSSLDESATQCPNDTQYFDIPCPGHVDDEVCKIRKNYNSSSLLVRDIPQIIFKKTQVPIELLHRNNVSV